MVSADDKTIIEMHLSGGTKHDAPEGRTSIEKAGARFKGVPLLMDRAYEGDKTRALASSYSREPVAPPKKNRKEPWDYDEELYKRGNVIERLFHRLKEFRKVFTRYDKLDSIYLVFV